MAGKPWYQDGLRFECSQCGDCCTGAPGYVWVNQAEIAALAEDVGMDAENFEAAYVRPANGKKSLTEHENGDCVFFDGEARKCTVYGARPRQCKTWPFWDSNVQSPEAWAATCEICPGSGQGKLHQIEHIESQRKQIRI